MSLPPSPGGVSFDAGGDAGGDAGVSFDPGGSPGGLGGVGNGGRAEGNGGLVGLVCSTSDSVTVPCGGGFVAGHCSTVSPVLFFF